MRPFGLWGRYCLLALLIAGQHPMPTVPHFPTPEAKHPLPGVDEPPVVVKGNRRVALNPAKLKQQADELVRVAQSIPPDIDNVTHGKLPTDLAARLKQIEKLSKQLRNEISP